MHTQCQLAMRAGIVGSFIGNSDRIMHNLLAPKILVLVTPGVTQA